MGRLSYAELFRRFDVIKRWMVDDLEPCIFDARANFLVAQGLLNYTEILGSFETGKGVGNGGENFDTFFERLGDVYIRLLRAHNRKGSRINVIYDDLRCGLTHEYMPKRKKFTIYGVYKKKSDLNLDQLKILVNQREIQVTAGVMHIQNSWHIITPKYWLDFKRACEQYRKELEDVNNKGWRDNFFTRVKNINIKNFNV